MSKAFSGTVFIDNVLTFWKERLKEYVKQHVIPGREREEMDVIEALLHADAPYRLWEECQSGIIHKKTIHEVEKVDDAIFKLKFRIVPLSEEDRKTAENVAVGLESLVVFCICNALRKEGRLIED